VGEQHLDGQDGAEAPEAITRAEAVFDKARRVAGVGLAPLAFAVAWFTTGSLHYEARMLSAILAGAAVLWITETLPLPVTALLGAALCIVMGVADPRTVLAPFADRIVFLFIGSFILARAMAIHGLDRRLALGFLSWRWLAAHPARLMAGLGLVTAVISMWVSNTATAAMMLPIALGLVHATGEREPGDGRGSRYATGMMLMVAFAASVGGIATPVGTPPNGIGISFIRERLGVNISFFRWVSIALPLFVVMFAALCVLLYVLHRSGRRAGSAQVTQYLHDRRAALGPWTRGQINTLIAFGVAFALWLAPGVYAAVCPGDAATHKLLENRLHESVVALVAALLLFVLPTDLRKGEMTLTWNQAVRIDWGTILLFGGGLTLGNLMEKTGVAAALGQAVQGGGEGSLWGLTGLSIAMAIFLSETTSNTAAATMVMPVVISMARQSGVDPLPPALGACLGASFGFMLPVSTPPNAIVYGSGLVPIPRMVRAGVLFDIIGFFIIWGGLAVLCPLLGLSAAK
jgi:sodium-dependent dicarboxylate transporter 2/3/5